MRVPDQTGPDPRRRGTAAMEFAVILPLLVTLVLGCVDFGRFAYTEIAVANAARAGAGFGANHPSTPATLDAWKAQVGQAVQDELGDFDPSLLSVTATPTAVEGGGWQAQVDVSYPFTMVVNWPGLPASMTLRQVAVLPSIRP
jgi:Flp pilus assembly protein TadG